MLSFVKKNLLYIKFYEIKLIINDMKYEIWDFFLGGGGIWGGERMFKVKERGKGGIMWILENWIF